MALGGLIAAALATGTLAADQTPTRELRGSCYCKAQAELMCTANLTARECDLRSRQELCDDWFWNERLACWNWGYGG